jgi:tryptophan synthase alpha chain
MNRLEKAFARADKEGRAALVIYLCAGDPSLPATPSLIAAAARAGADIVEVGMPFSDPTADGPTIQKASERALAKGTTLRGVLDAIAKTRAQGIDVPIVLFGYYNPILRFGEERLAAAAKKAGVDALLVVDLPPESAETLLAALATHELELVPLVAPTSTPERIERAAKVAGSFLYYVSMTGVTGSAATNLEQAARRAAEIAETTGKKVVVGFGLRTPQDVAQIAAHADGVVVGSAIVRAIEDASDPERAIGELVLKLAAATRR